MRMRGLMIFGTDVKDIEENYGEVNALKTYPQLHAIRGFDYRIDVELS